MFRTLLRLQVRRGPGPGANCGQQWQVNGSSKHRQGGDWALAGLRGLLPTSVRKDPVQCLGVSRRPQPGPPKHFRSFPSHFSAFHSPLPVPPQHQDVLCDRTRGGLNTHQGDRMADAISGNYTSAPELHITRTLIPKVTLDFVGLCRKRRNLTKPRGRQCSRHGLLQF